MKKPFKHTELSDKVKCHICERPIKMNVIIRKPTKRTFTCYKHRRRYTLLTSKESNGNLYRI